MADKTNAQTIPVELLLSHIGKQVKVDIEAHQEKLEDEIAKRRQRLEELQARRMEVSTNAVVDAPVAVAATPPPLPVSVLDTAAELDDTGDDDWLMEMALDDDDLDDEMGGDVQTPSLDTSGVDLPLDDFEFPDDEDADGGNVDLSELEDDLLTDLPDLNDGVSESDGENAEMLELDDDLLTDLPDLNEPDAVLTVAHNDTTVVNSSVVTTTAGMDDILSDVAALDPDLVDDGWEF